MQGNITLPSTCRISTAVSTAQIHHLENFLSFPELKFTAVQIWFYVIILILQLKNLKISIICFPRSCFGKKWRCPKSEIPPNDHYVRVGALLRMLLGYIPNSSFNPSRPNPGRRDKNNLSFYFLTQRSVKKKIKVNFYFNTNFLRAQDGKG